MITRKRQADILMETLASIVIYILSFRKLVRTVFQMLRKPDLAESHFQTDF